MPKGLVASAKGSETSLVVCCASREEQVVLLLAVLSVYAPIHIAPNLVAETDFRPVEREKVAVVDFSDAPFEKAIRAIRELRNARFDVIGWARGSNGWPVALRARALLAGAEAVFDSEMPDAAERLRQQVARCLHNQAARKEERAFLLDRMHDMGIVGDGPQMLSLFGNVMRISRLCDVPVLIYGETGTGKELIARAIHSLDAKRRTKPFLPLNCAALNIGVAESELFGHRRGAFTGATRDRLGLIRSAEGGVLFLDEVGELDLGLQAKLLRVLEDGRVLGVGEDRERQFDTRIIAATNRSLMDMVANGSFRADLYHRLSVISFRLPSLRERRDDLPALVAHFVQKHKALAGSSSIDVSPEFLKALASLEIPGNVRQLENLVRRALLAKNDGDSLGLSDLPHEAWAELVDRTGEETEPVSLIESEPHDAGSLGAELLHLSSVQNWKLSRLLEEIERLVLKAALEARHGDLTEAGLVLGLKARTLYNKRRKYQLDR
jgi:DNA-binding NtrC family response regulator